MAAILTVNPDTEFIRDVLGSGARDLKKCYQCATCTSVCDLATETMPFPRKQMIEAQWGLKDKLMGDPAIWLCHNCDHCTAHCPRDAKPGQVMGALRAQAIRNFAFPRFMGKVTADPKFLPLLLALPILIFAAMALWAPKGLPTPALEFTNVFPDSVLEGLFFAVSGVVMLVYAVGVVRMVQALRREGFQGRLLPHLAPTVMEIVGHKRFSKCGTENNRYWGHLLTFSGFGGLFGVEIIMGIGYWTNTILPPLPLLHPLKLLVNFFTLLISTGLIVMLAERMGGRSRKAPNSYFDWFFLLTLVGVVITGILSEILRLEQARMQMYSAYFVHLVLVFSLFLYAPYSKFAHLVYRTVAIAVTREQREQKGRATAGQAALGSSQ